MKKKGGKIILKPSFTWGNPLADIKQGKAAVIRECCFDTVVGAHFVRAVVFQDMGLYTWANSHEFALRWWKENFMDELVSFEYQDWGIPGQLVALGRVTRVVGRNWQRGDMKITVRYDEVDEELIHSLLHGKSTVERMMDAVR